MPYTRFSLHYVEGRQHNARAADTRGWWRVELLVRTKFVFEAMRAAATWRQGDQLKGSRVRSVA